MMKIQALLGVTEQGLMVFMMNSFIGVPLLAHPSFAILLGQQLLGFDKLLLAVALSHHQMVVSSTMDTLGFNAA